MKRQIFTLVSVSGFLLMTAQNSTPDSIMTTSLDEIVVEAPKVIVKADMDVYFPSKNAVNNSKNGFQLLSNLSIPSIMVSEPLGMINSAGEAVEIRINGRKASPEQLRNLLPETIRKVEWIDNPGLRYNGASSVLNFIVANPAAGGSLMAFAIQAPNVEWGQFRADLKINSGRSQWQVGGNYKETNNINTYRDYTETFTYPDGSSLQRMEQSRGGKMDYPKADAWASYNYVKPDTTVFVAEFNMSRMIKDQLTYYGLLSLSSGGEDILLTDTKGSNGSTPGLSLYLQQNLTESQMLVFSASSSLYSGKTFSDYVERYPDSPAQVENLLYANGNLITDIHTDIRDLSLAYAVESDYIHTWNKSRFTAGVSWQGNRNRSEYRSLDGEVFHKTQNRTYIFAEYFRKLGKFTATAGIGLQYTEFNFKETGKRSNSWNPRPQATVTYSLSSKHKFRLGFSSSQTTPSLSETSSAQQQIDGMQWNVGNQNLKTFSTYNLSFRYSFNIPRFNGSFRINATTSPHAIAQVMAWEGDKLVTSYENSKGYRNLSFTISPDFEIVPSWLSVTGTIRYNMQRSEGTGYVCHYNDWDGIASLQLSHWGFTLSGKYSKEKCTLRGEKLSWGEKINIIDLTYNTKCWQFSAGVLMPFGQYDRGSESLNKWNTNEQHYRLNMRIPYIQIAYNLQWGRQKKGASKLVDAKAETDKSSAAGR